MYIFFPNKKFVTKSGTLKKNIHQVFVCFDLKVLHFKFMPVVMGLDDIFMQFECSKPAIILLKFLKLVCR